jgi:hypothetical protein
MNDEFYIGWEDKAAPGIGRAVRRVVVVLVILAILLGATFALSQRMIGRGVFEWGAHKTFSGVLKATPYAHLLVPRPGNAEGQARFSSYYLVAQWKYGVNPNLLMPLDGKTVTMQGTLIYNGDQTMIEVVDGTLQATNIPMPMVESDSIKLGRRTFQGEIVDSKCYLGVMNPGQWTPHRACAIRCISGGIPPILVVQSKDEPPKYLMLVSADGKPVNQQVLDMVAEPVEITGEVEQQGDLLILRADPATYRRL